MKKFRFIFIAAFVLVLGAFGCSSKNNQSVDGSLVDIMASLYSDINENDLPMYLENMEVNEENIKSFIGVDNVEYEEALASESMVTSTAHSVVLLRLKDTKNVQKVMDDIKENVDPRKWICVGIERDEVIIKNRGNLIMVVIVQDEQNRKAIDKAFDKLK